MTPDSFSDGSGDVPSVEDILERARAMAVAVRSYGCGMIDLGAESTKPGVGSVTAETETARLIPALKAVRSAFADIPLSVDTCHAETARLALEQGADIINDVSAFSRDFTLLDVVATYCPGYVLTHGGTEHFAGHRAMGGYGCGGDAVDTMLRFFESGLSALVRAGLPENHIVLDPGIGFGKSPYENWEILRNISRLHVLGRPLYAGISRKSLFGWLLGLEAHERGEVTNVLTGMLATQGVLYHRVHDVVGAVHALKIAAMMSPDL